MISKFYTVPDWAEKEFVHLQCNFFFNFGNVKIMQNKEAKLHEMHNEKSEVSVGEEVFASSNEKKGLDLCF